MTVLVVLSYFSYYNQKLEAEIWGQGVFKEYHLEKC